MRRIRLVASALTLLYLFNACKKNDSPGATNARTVANFSGTYSLSVLNATAFGVTINLLDSLPACERDNLIKLNTDLTANFIDTGVVCTPRTDSSGVWSLSQNTDTLYLAGTANYINSWDGTTLVLSGNQTVSGISAAVSTTLVKK